MIVNPRRHGHIHRNHAWIRAESSGTMPTGGQIMNMKQWAADMKAAPVKKPFPVLSFPGLTITGDKVIDAVTNGERQAAGVMAIAARYPEMAGAVTFMDLSVEAEAFGGRVRFADDEVPTIVGRILSSDSDVQALAIPEIGAGRTGECLKALKILKEQITDRPVFAGHIGPYSLTGRLMDMTELMVNMTEEPEFVHAALEKVTQFLISYAKALKATGCDGILMAEPAAESGRRILHVICEADRGRGSG